MDAWWISANSERQLVTLVNCSERSGARRNNGDILACKVLPALLPGKRWRLGGVGRCRLRHWNVNPCPCHTRVTHCSVNLPSRGWSITSINRIILGQSNLVPLSSCLNKWNKTFDQCRNQAWIHTSSNLDSVKWLVLSAVCLLTTVNNLSFYMT